MNLNQGAVLFATALLLTGCGPSKEELAEKRRIECLDTFCEGDVEPPRDRVREVALKINGQWYVGPKEYFSGKSGAVFYWPSKTPEIGRTDGQPYPEKGKPFYDVAIEIFLGTPKQVPSKSMYRRLLELEVRGLVVEKTTPSSELQVWRTQEGDSSETWYVATALKEPNGDPPAVACREIDPKHARCTMGFRWKPDVAANMRFRAVHGPDWPAIYLETERVLQQLRKA